MYELDALIHFLIEDTKHNRIMWNNIIDSYDNTSYHSLDFRKINKNLPEWTAKNLSLFNGWKDAYIANIMNGFVYVTKEQNLPPFYRLYIQPDADSKIFLTCCTPEQVKPLFDIINSQMSVAYNQISDFIEHYIALHFNSDDLDNDEDSF